MQLLYPVLFLVITSLLTIGIMVAWYKYGTCGTHFEGFENKLGTKKNELLQLIGNVKRITLNLANPTLWKERIEMAYMSPQDLARRYIKQSQK